MFVTLSSAPAPLRASLAHHSLQVGSLDSDALIEFLDTKGLLGKVRFPESSAFGVKPVSKEGSQRLIRAAINYALMHGHKSVSVVHKGNIMKYTEGGFRDWGYELVKTEYRQQCVTERESWILANFDFGHPPHLCFGPLTD